MWPRRSVTNLFRTKTPGWNDPVARMDVHVSANNWCVKVCTHHRLHTVLKFLQNVSYHVHITCLGPDSDLWRKTGWWWSYRWEGFHASDGRDLMTNCRHVWGNKTWTVLTRSRAVFVAAKTGVLGAFPNLDQVAIVPKPNQSIGTLRWQDKSCRMNKCEVSVRPGFA